MAEWEDELRNCAERARALLWTSDREVVGVAALTVHGLGPVLLLARGEPEYVQADPSSVFAALVACRAMGAVLVHTHTAASVPSPADLAVTRRLVAAGVVLGIPLLAHLVIGLDRWTDCCDGAYRQRPYGLSSLVA